MPNLNERGIKPPIESVEAERDTVVTSFNQYYFDLSQKSQKKDYWYSFYFKMLKAGVEKAIGKEVSDPRHAIPADYTGDGSFQTTFQSKDGQELTQTEYIPLDILNRYEGGWEKSPAPFYQTLYTHSQPFKQAHPEHYHGRVQLEAYYYFKNGSPLSPSIPSPKKDFEMADWVLMNRRDLRLPVLPNT